MRLLSGVEIKARISDTRHVFLTSIWPLWRERIAATGIISVEGSERPLERAADSSGTDAFMVRHMTGVLVPLASRIEFYNEKWNNPDNPLYAKHYPRFTIRLAVRQRDDSLFDDVECRKRMASLNDPVSRRYLPLYTFQSLVNIENDGCVVLQSSCVETVDLFEYVLHHKLYDLGVGKVSYTNRERDAYRMVTVDKLRAAGIDVITLSF